MSENAGGAAPETDPRRCTATNRAGVRCGRWAIKGRTTCANHGGRSTGPRTTAGKLRSLSARLRHGNRAKSDLYREALRATNPDVYDAAGGVDLDRELRLARVRLAQASGGDVETIAVLLGVVARLASTQAVTLRDADQPANPGAFHLTMEVVGADRKPRPVESQASEAAAKEPVNPTGEPEPPRA
jgi:hypothetical protein